jgi:branched-chain amino acid transport system substrate-binding protein
MGIMRQARELGFNAKLFAFTVGPSEAEFGTLGDTANLVFGATNWDKSLKTKGNQDFVAAYTQKFGREPDYHSAANYASLQVLEEAVRRVGSLDQDKLADAIRQLEMETVYGTFKVDENGAQTGYRAYLLQWQNGSPVLVWPEANAQGRYILPTPPWSERP